MNLYCIKCLKFTKNNDFKINHKIVAKSVFILLVLTAVLKRLRLSMKNNFLIY